MNSVHPPSLLEIASLARKSIDPGLLLLPDGKRASAGSCLHACLVLALLLKRFSSMRFSVRGGGPDEGGAVDCWGVLRGHYWLEVHVDGGFVVDITADQFGYDAVVVMPLADSYSRYRPGPQEDVSSAFNELVWEFSCEEDLLV